MEPSTRPTATGRTANLISVIIPAFNCAPTILKTIESVLRAREKNRIEIIVVDDCSTDNTVEVVKAKFNELRNEKHRLTVIKSWRNRGAGACRNKGLKLATGQYVLFVDADDIVEEGAIDELARVAKATKAEFVTFRYHYVTDPDTRDEPGMLTKDREVWASVLPECKNGVIDPYVHSSISTMTNYPWNKFIRRDFAKAIGLKYSETPVNNDIAAHWCLYSNARKVALYDRALIYHYVLKGNDQITNRFDQRRLAVFEALSDAEAHVFRSTATISAFYHHFMDFKLNLLKWVYKRLPPDHREAFFAYAMDSYKSYGKSEHTFLALESPKLADQSFWIKYSPANVFL
ncbi:glycosyltransferase family 2 protein [Rhizobium sp. TRM96647]|uniref:glycosyltransferase family 2 protein n=1 Tax=unclassified Rhizobium TaxID=2613769 RepID=UPI0021E742B3|nr:MULTISPECIES: glycosyltransferase family 2 protein [unclassified Rhizobium]MCV3736651.1 glycosyltransferase family 2 protein [Rhizobium sp. TRM96647]MCV3759020.1 glycosyltransferase family 2 protein [Rhizobium sp. TRM96650]